MSLIAIPTERREALGELLFGGGAPMSVDPPTGPIPRA